MATMKKSLRREDLSEEDIARFLAKVNKDTWWTGGCFENGYGAFQLNGKVVRAHSIAYAIHYGVVPKGFLIRHKCDNFHWNEPGGSKNSYRKCVNWKHLELGTERENTMDAVERGRHRVESGDSHWSRRNPEKVARGERRNLKLTQSDVDSIRRLYATGTTQSALGKRFKVGQVTISKIVLFKKWRPLNMSEDLKRLLMNVSNEKERKALKEAYEAGKKAAKKPTVNSTFVTSVIPKDK